MSIGNTKKIFCTICMLSLFLMYVSGAEENGADGRLISLLSGYLANDLQLQKLSLTAQSQKLTYDSTKINNGIALSLSTGTMRIYTKNGSSVIEVEPTATVSIPQANDTSVTADVPLTFSDGSTSASSISSSGTSVEDASVEVSTGIISGAKLKRKAALLEAERAVLEAERNVQDRAVTAEKEFYTALKTLYGYAVTMLEDKSDEYTDDLALRKLIAQGYSESSSSYRTAYLKVESDKRDVEKDERLLERETAVFAKKCGVDYTAKTIQVTGNTAEKSAASAIEFLPSSIPGADALDVLTFSPDCYTETESALWDQYIGALKRKADYEYTLKGSFGYTFNNSASETDSVDGGLFLAWNGLTAKAGISLPTGSRIFGTAPSGASTDPVYTFSLTLTPNTFRTAKISRAQDSLTEQLEQIAVKSAKNNYDTAVLDSQTSLSDIQWSLKSYGDEFELYNKLESDMAVWLKDGVVTQSDYNDARDNRDKARLNKLISAVELLIYNDETKLLFHTDTGIADGSTPAIHNLQDDNVTINSQSGAKK